MRRKTPDLVVIPLLLAPMLLAGCSHAPQAPRAQVAPPQDLAGIGPRPAFFGRHAWDEQQAAARAKAGAPAKPAPIEAPPVVAKVSPPPPPVAAPPPVAQTAVAPPLPAPAPVQPIAPPPLPPAPVAQTAAAAPPPPLLVPPRKPAKPPKSPKDAKTPFKLPFGLKPVEAPPPPPPLVGGYGDAPDKKAVDAAATFAVHEMPGYELKGVYSAKTQVVAGTNYSLCLWVRQVKHEANPLSRRLVAATVFQGLDRHYELTHWHEVADCHAGT